MRVSSTIFLLIIALFYMQYPAFLYHSFTLVFVYPKELLFVYILYKHRVKMQRLIKNFVGK